jgi:hypothetical protein
MDEGGEEEQQQQQETPELSRILPLGTLQIC